MSLPPVFDHLSRRSRMDLRWLMVVSLLIAGCVGKRIDLLTSRVDKEASSQADSEMESRRVKDQSESSADERHLIAEDDQGGPLRRLTGFTRRDADQPGEDRFASRFRAILGRDNTPESAVTSDPFVASHETRESNRSASGQFVTSEKPSSIDRLLASFSRKTPVENPTEMERWWEADTVADSTSASSHADAEQQFADEFDSRLDRLRAELASAPDSSTENQNLFADVDAGDEHNPFANAPDPQAATVANVAAIAEESGFDALDKLNPPKTDLYSLPRTDSRNGVKDRVRTMLADAQSVWSEGDTQLAYRMALEAQALAVLEGVHFTSNERRPQELAAKIEQELRGTTSVEMSQQDFPMIAARGSEEANLSPLGFPEFDLDAEDWDLPGDGPVIVPNESPTDLSEATGGSGVNLFPPDDDFPSEAEMADWGGDIINPFAESLSEDQEQSAEEIRLTIHEGLDGSPPLAAWPTEEVPGLTGADNRELLSSVSEHKSRVFDIKKMEWPSLPPLSTKDGSSESEQSPIRVAQAPRFAPEVETAVESATAAADASETPVGGGSILGQIWRSQPFWFVGGLVLLIIALRLLPWPREGSAE